jgi:hypothetical protein
MPPFLPFLNPTHQLSAFHRTTGFYSMVLQSVAIECADKTPLTNASIVSYAYTGKSSPRSLALPRRCLAHLFLSIFLLHSSFSIRRQQQHRKPRCRALDQIDSSWRSRVLSRDLPHDRPSCYGWVHFSTTLTLHFLPSRTSPFLPYLPHPLPCFSLHNRLP